VSRPYQVVRSQAATYLTLGGSVKPTLALRIGGDKLWGPHPFFDAAFVGGASTVRGWREQRFAGDASLYGNAELRMFITKFFFLLPSDFGVFGLADAGRVFSPGERSTMIHQGYGGGIWVAPLGKSNTVSLAMARSREGNGFYLGSGFPF
jgi:hemolysin activation/secretion protein